MYVCSMTTLKSNKVYNISSNIKLLYQSSILLLNFVWTEHSCASARVCVCVSFHSLYIWILNVYRFNFDIRITFISYSTHTHTHLGSYYIVFVCTIEINNVKICIYYPYKFSQLCSFIYNVNLLWEIFITYWLLRTCIETCTCSGRHKQTLQFWWWCGVNFASHFLNLYFIRWLESDCLCCKPVFAWVRVLFFLILKVLPNV